jgi:hypothetical protein
MEAYRSLLAKDQTSHGVASKSRSWSLHRGRKYCKSGEGDEGSTGSQDFGNETHLIDATIRSVSA